MKIIHVIKAPFSKRLIWDPQPQRQILYLAVAQQEQGLDIAVMTDAEGFFAEACREQGVPVIVAPSFVTAAATDALEGGALEGAESEYSNLCANLVRKFTDFRPNIIHCHDDVSAASVIDAGNIMDIPCVFTPHHPLIPPLYHFWMAKKFAILCTWKNIYDQLEKLEIPESDLHYVMSGTASCVYSHEDFDRKPNLITVEGVSDRKGILGSLIVMVELRRRHGHECPTLDVYSGESLLEYYKETASVLGLDDIIEFHRIQFNVLDRCRESGILVMPSHTEAGPLVVLEAMSRGMPIVATDVGDVAEMLPDQRYGRVAPKDSIMMLADAIDATLSDVASSQFAPKPLIERHRSLYTAEKMAEGVGSAYNKIIAGKLSSAGTALPSSSMSDKD